MLHRKHHKWANSKWKGSQLCVLLCVLKSGREWEGGVYWFTALGDSGHHAAEDLVAEASPLVVARACGAASFYLVWSWKLRADDGSNTSILSPGEGESCLLERAAPEFAQWPGVVLLAGDQRCKHMACVEPFTLKSLKNITLKQVLIRTLCIQWPCRSVNASDFYLINKNNICNVILNKADHAEAVKDSLYII